MMIKDCEVIELIKDAKVFRRYQNCTVEFGELGIIIHCGKNKIFVSPYNLLGYESVNGRGIIYNMEVYCSNTF